MGNIIEVFMWWINKISCDFGFVLIKKFNFQELCKYYCVKDVIKGMLNFQCNKVIEGKSIDIIECLQRYKYFIFLGFGVLVGCSRLCNNVYF